VLALDRARVGPSPKLGHSVQGTSKFADKPSNSTQLKQIQLDSSSLGHYVDPRHEARS
jgi:hypothetical protein